MVLADSSGPWSERRDRQSRPGKHPDERTYTGRVWYLTESQHALGHRTGDTTYSCLRGLAGFVPHRTTAPHRLDCSSCPRRFPGGLIPVPGPPCPRWHRSHYALDWGPASWAMGSEKMMCCLNVLDSVSDIAHGLARALQCWKSLEGGRCSWLTGERGRERTWVVNRWREEERCQRT